MTVNNYPVTVYGPGEVCIHTNARQLMATDGKVFLTRMEILGLACLLMSDPGRSLEAVVRRTGTPPPDAPYPG